MGKNRGLQSLQGVSEESMRRLCMLSGHSGDPEYAAHGCDGGQEAAGRGCGYGAIQNQKQYTGPVQSVHLGALSPGR